MQNAVPTETGLSEQDEALCVGIFRDVMRARHLLYGDAANVAERFGLHPAELNIVDILGKFGSLSMGDLARKTFISPSNTTSTVKKLEKTNLVKRKRADWSEREVTVSLTSKGRALFRKCYPQVLGSVHEHISNRLTKSELNALSKILGKLVA